MPSSSSNSSEPMSDIVNRCRANSNLCKASYLLLGKHGSLSVCGRLLFVLPKRLCEVNLKVKFRPYTLSTQFASVMSTWISVEPRTACMRNIWDNQTWELEWKTAPLAKVQLCKLLLCDEPFVRKVKYKLAAREVKSRFGATLERSAHDCETRL